jgi:hypothetical protein
MGKGMSMLLVLVVLTAVSVSSQQAGLSQQPVQSHVVPLKKFSKLSMDKRYETVAGDPAKVGAPFVIRIHAEAGYIIIVLRKNSVCACKGCTPCFPALNLYMSICRCLTETARNRWIRANDKGEPGRGRKRRVPPLTHAFRCK